MGMASLHAASWRLAEIASLKSNLAKLGLNESGNSEANKADLEVQLNISTSEFMEFALRGLHFAAAMQDKLQDYLHSAGERCPSLERDLAWLQQLVVPVAMEAARLNSATLVDLEVEILADPPADELKNLQSKLERTRTNLGLLGKLASGAKVEEVASYEAKLLKLTSENEPLRLSLEVMLETARKGLCELSLFGVTYLADEIERTESQLHSEEHDQSGFAAALLQCRLQRQKAKFGELAVHASRLKVEHVAELEKELKQDEADTSFTATQERRQVEQDLEEAYRSLGELSVEGSKWQAQQIAILRDTARRTSSDELLSQLHKRITLAYRQLSRLTLEAAVWTSDEVVAIEETLELGRNDEHEVLFLMDALAALRQDAAKVRMYSASCRIFQTQDLLQESQNSAVLRADLKEQKREQGEACAAALTTLEAEVDTLNEQKENVHPHSLMADSIETRRRCAAMELGEASLHCALWKMVEMRELEAHIRSGDINDDHILEAFEQDLVKLTADFLDVAPAAISFVESEAAELLKWTKSASASSFVRDTLVSQIKSNRRNAVYLQMQSAFLRLADVKQNLLSCSTEPVWEALATEYETISQEVARISVEALNFKEAEVRELEKQQLTNGNSRNITTSAELSEAIRDFEAFGFYAAKWYIFHHQVEARTGAVDNRLGKLCWDGIGWKMEEVTFLEKSIASRPLSEIQKWALQKEVFLARSELEEISNMTILWKYSEVQRARAKHNEAKEAKLDVSEVVQELEVSSTELTLVTDDYLRLLRQQQVEVDEALRRQGLNKAEQAFLEKLLSKVNRALDLANNRMLSLFGSIGHEDEANAVADALGQTSDTYNAMLRWQHLRDQERNLEQMFSKIAVEQLSFAKEQQWSLEKLKRQQDRVETMADVVRRERTKHAEIERSKKTAAVAAARESAERQAKEEQKKKMQDDFEREQDRLVQEFLKAQAEYEEAMAKRKVLLRLQQDVAWLQRPEKDLWKLPRHSTALARQAHVFLTIVDGKYYALNWETNAKKKAKSTTIRLYRGTKLIQVSEVGPATESTGCVIVDPQYAGIQRKKFSLRAMPADSRELCFVVKNPNGQFLELCANTYEQYRLWVVKLAHLIDHWNVKVSGGEYVPLAAQIAAKEAEEAKAEIAQQVAVADKEELLDEEKTPPRKLNSQMASRLEEEKRKSEKKAAKEAAQKAKKENSAKKASSKKASPKKSPSKKKKKDDPDEEDMDLLSVRKKLPSEFDVSEKQEKKKKKKKKGGDDGEKGNKSKKKENKKGEDGDEKDGKKKKKDNKKDKKKQGDGDEKDSKKKKKESKKDKKKKAAEQEEVDKKKDSQKKSKK
mmetsp:Transcript_35809/g.70323  ORF Transcript_35809/g.70323 Transcript_35809/m.70323 type:complete len:1335 (-) Transcript_35809:58-4062(-)